MQVQPKGRCLILRPLSCFGLDIGARLLFCLEKSVSCVKSTGNRNGGGRRRKQSTSINLQVRPSYRRASAPNTNMQHVVHCAAGVLCDRPKKEWSHLMPD